MAKIGRNYSVLKLEKLYKRTLYMTLEIPLAKEILDI